MDGMAMAARDEGAKDGRHSVERNVDLVTGALERLGGLVARLDERLTPVLRDAPDERVLADVSDRVLAAPESPHARTLREIFETVTQQAERLERTLARLDLS